MREKKFGKVCNGRVGLGLDSMRLETWGPCGFLGIRVLFGV